VTTCAGADNATRRREEERTRKDRTDAFYVNGLPAMEFASGSAITYTEDIPPFKEIAF
jgi:hypothetical protein